MNYIDVHCHINDSDYGDVPALMQRILRSGVKKIICAGYDLPSSLYGRDLADKYPFVYFTAGLHPTELKNVQKSPCPAESDEACAPLSFRAKASEVEKSIPQYSDVIGVLNEIERLAKHPKCVAIGEIGLDYHYPDTDKALQNTMFTEQLRLAKRLNLPVQVHSRDCAEDTASVLKEHASGLKILLHCYSYSAETATELEKVGVSFSFGGTCTYSGSKKAKKAIAALRISSILSETDSPYLVPASKKGSFPNTPESIGEIVQAIALIRGESEQAVADGIWTNAHKLFTKLNN